MPSSPIVCHLRREVARRIHHVATSIEGLSEREEPTLNGTKLGPRRGNAPYSVVVDLPSDDRGDDTESFGINQTRSNILGVSRLAASDGRTSNSSVCGAANADNGRLHGSRAWEIQTRALSFTGGGNSPCLFSSRKVGGVGSSFNVASENTLGFRGEDRRGDSRSILTAPRRKGCLTHARMPRAKTVRFLMGDVGVRDNTRVSKTNRRGEPERQLDELEPTSRQFIVDGILKKCWTCVWCDKGNTEGVVVCSTCGRHRDTSYVDSPQVNKVLKKRLTCASQADTGRKQGRYGGATRTRGDSCGTLAPRKHTTSPKYCKRVEAKITSLKKDNSAYDLSSFAKMRQTNDQAVEARLNLTGEIQSLLSVIRGKRG